MIKLINGDCFKELDNISNVNLVITSPPYADVVDYGNDIKNRTDDDYINWFIPIIQKIYHSLNKDGSFILNMGDKVSKGYKNVYVYKLVIAILEKTNFKLFDTYIWYKKSGMPTPNGKRLNNRFEYIYHFVKNKDFKANTDAIREPYAEISLKRFNSGLMGNRINENGIVKGTTKKYEPNPLGKKPDNVFRFNTNSTLRKSYGHPAPFNPELPAYFIKWLTGEKDIVLDCFMGSGSTGVACKDLNRKFIGIELNKTYFDIAKERLNYDLK